MKESVSTSVTPRFTTLIMVAAFSVVTALKRVRKDAITHGYNFELSVYNRAGPVKDERRFIDHEASAVEKLPRSFRHTKTWILSAKKSSLAVSLCARTTVRPCGGASWFGERSYRRPPGQIWRWVSTRDTRRRNSFSTLLFNSRDLP